MTRWSDQGGRDSPDLLVPEGEYEGWEDRVEEGEGHDQVEGPGREGLT